MNYTKAYMIANPDCDKRTAQACSSRLMAQENVLSALHEEADKRQKLAGQKQLASSQLIGPLLA